MFTKFLERGNRLSRAQFALLARAILRDVGFGTPLHHRTRRRHRLSPPNFIGPAELHCLIVELDRCRHLRKRSARRYRRSRRVRSHRLLDHRKSTVDHILSGLPLSHPGNPRSHPRRSPPLTPDGSFRQLTVMPWIYYRMAAATSRTCARFVPRISAGRRLRLELPERDEIISVDAMRPLWPHSGHESWSVPAWPLGRSPRHRTFAAHFR